MQGRAGGFVRLCMYGGGARAWSIDSGVLDRGTKGASRRGRMEEDEQVDWVCVVGWWEPSGLGEDRTYSCFR